jgi:hypothetical protein
MNGPGHICPVCHGTLLEGVQTEELFDRAVRFIGEAVEDATDVLSSWSVCGAARLGERRSRLQNWRARRRQETASAMVR